MTNYLHSYSNNWLASLKQALHTNVTSSPWQLCECSWCTLSGPNRFQSNFRAPTVSSKRCLVRGMSTNKQGYSSQMYVAQRCSIRMETNASALLTHSAHHVEILTHCALTFLHCDNCATHYVPHVEMPTHRTDSHGKLLPVTNAQSVENSQTEGMPSDPCVSSMWQLRNDSRKK